jgi:transposase
VRKDLSGPAAALFVAQWSKSLLRSQSLEAATFRSGGFGVLLPEVQAEILNLYFSEKKSLRSIAEKFGIHRKSVERVVRRRSVQLGRQAAVRKSILDPYKDYIKETLQKDPRVTSTALLNGIRVMGFNGSYWTLKEFVRDQRELVVRPREAFLRLDFAPGEVAQVDWGEFGDVFGDGVKIHCFAMVLAYSRMIYLEFTRSEKFEEFIRCHENAFRYFGGAPRECWYDNLASAVSDRLGGLIRFNARFMAYMAHHTVRPHACNVAKGNEKGRVEDLIKYIRMNFWSGRQFSDFEDLTKQMIVWRNQVANQREHRSTRKVVRIFFESSEKLKLQTLNPVPYDTDEVFSKNVSSDFHLQYETNRYSVPWTLAGMTVTVRVNQQEIKVFYNEKFICGHCRSYLKFKVFTTESHRTGLLERKPGASRDVWQLGYVKGLGPEMAEYVALVRQGPRSLKYELSRLVGLITVYGKSVVIETCRDCLGAGVVGVDNLELYLRRRNHPSEAMLMPKLMNFSHEKLNRVHPEVDLRKYDALYFEGEKTLSASEVKDSGNNERSASGGSSGVEASLLQSVDERGFEQNEGPGPGDDYQASSRMDLEGEIGTKELNDPEQNQDGKVWSSSDSGEF